MLEIQELSKSYGKTLAVDKVSFFVPDGQVGILLGPNGAGKSTIIKSIAGLLRYKGRIGIQGISSKELAAKKIFAYVPEIPAMFDALTVREHIEYVRKAYGSTITDETVVQLVRKKPDTYIDITVDMDELDLTSSESKATYDEIKDYIFDKYHVKVSSLYIAQVKQRHGIIERDCYNNSKKESPKQPQCPTEKVKLIEEALRHFKMIP